MKKIIALTIAFIVIFLLLFSQLIFHDTEDSYNIQEIVTEIENTVDSNYAFYFDGEIYQLPVNYDIFVENGWNDKNIEDIMRIKKGNSIIKFTKRGDEVFNTYLTKDNIKVPVIYDYGPMGEYEVFQIFFDKETLGNKTVVLPKGITFETTIEEVVNIFGVPVETNNITDEIVYRYKPENDTYISEYDYLEIYFKDGIVSKFNMNSRTPKFSAEDLENMPVLGLDEDS